VVEANTTSVQSAVAEVADQPTPRFLVVKLHNGNQSTSWPMAMFSAVTTRFVHNGTDCNWLTNAQQMLAWGLLNEKALELTEQKGYLPLTSTFR